ncbi:MAG: class I SAM-dependent methyltransferase [Firmicutes bacterium]|nr:class I SAM-dependent methyltransferase [Bacillota bacterium]
MDKPLAFARELVQSVVSTGDIVVDATCGNGHDTIFLAQLVGAEGQVYAFDIQKTAIEITQKKVIDAGLQKCVTFVEASHAEAAHWPQEPNAAVMFNLGYLPGGDHAVVTRPETTVAALQVAVRRLRENGVITLVVYTGHDGGEQEYRFIREYCASLSQQDFAVLEYRFINQKNQPPLLLAIARV